MIRYVFSNKIGNAKSKLRNGGIDEDDGDYATLRELPLAPVLAESGDDTTSEEGKVSNGFFPVGNNHRFIIFRFR